MNAKDNTILTINAGSSSIKFALYSLDQAGQKLFAGEISGVNQGSAALKVTDFTTDRTHEEHLNSIDFAAAVSTLSKIIERDTHDSTIVAVGHRFVMGGPHHNEPEIITQEVFDDLHSIAALDPDHAPAALNLIQTMRQQWPEAIHVACYDTAFFRDLPRSAQIIPLPRRFEQFGLRRYGFHGLSYTYLQHRFEAIAGEKALKGRVIYAHLGSGASLAATREAMPVDTTMSFSPVSGVVMSTRSGDLDPTISWFLQQQANVSPQEFNKIVSSESGLLGVSEISADMYTLLQQEKSDTRAAEAIELFCYQVRKAIGSLSATIGGLDSLVFSGGIGEKSSALRARICSGLEYLGVELQESLNNQSSDCISAPHSSVGVHIIPTDESHTLFTLASRVLNSIGK